MAAVCFFNQDLVFYYKFHNSCSGNGIWYCFLISIIVGLRTQISFKIMWHSNKIHCDGLGPQIIWYLTIWNLQYLHTVPIHTTRHRHHYASKYTKASVRDSAWLCWNMLSAGNLTLKLSFKNNFIAPYIHIFLLLENIYFAGITTCME